jgi:hypothetical protein
MSNSPDVPSFAQDIKPLFRDIDRSSMDFVFDLWDYQEVKDHAQDILERVSDGTMPCDEQWPQERIELFRRWIETGMSA